MPNILLSALLACLALGVYPSSFFFSWALILWIIGILLPICAWLGWFTMVLTAILVIKRMEGREEWIVFLGKNEHKVVGQVHSDP